MNPNAVSYFAQTDARNQKVPFGIKSKDRSRHVYVIGKTGMGKSTLLENLAVQDIQNGEGMAFIDPHGKTADLLLEYVPKERISDVIYFAPFDTDYPISFNVMEDVGPDKRHLVANGLMSAFKKIWVDAWSARMEYILNNILLALLEYPGSTLIGVNRMLADKDYRKKVVDNISDPSVKAFWVDEFAKYGERYMQEAGAAIQNKIGQFVANPLVRNIIGQPHSTFDIRKIMDERKILIINLSKGRVGEANANLLGSMLITKIYLGAMSRADVSERVLNVLPQFYLFVDEFQSFANESFADILSEARKYKLNLTIAHQYIEQMSEEVRAAVFGNVGTMITFRVGAYDAEVLEKEFMPTFTAEDLVNLGFVQIYLKLMIDGVTSPPFSATTLPPIKKQEIHFKDEIIEHSRSTFARPKATVEHEIHEWHKPISAQSDSRSGRPHDASSNNKYSSGPMHERGGRDHGTHKQGNHTQAYSGQSHTHPVRHNDHIKSRPSPDQPKRHEHNPFKDIKVDKDGILHATTKETITTKETEATISLEALAKQKEKKRAVDLKVPSKENLAGLKEALASITEHAKKQEDSVSLAHNKDKRRVGIAIRHSPRSIADRSAIKTKDIEKRAASDTAADKSHDVAAKENTKPTPVHEVPEEVLRTILDA